MTHTSSIHQLFSIEDKNIKFNDELVLPEVTIKGITYQQIAGTLSYHPVCCEKCGVDNASNQVIKHGFKTVRLLLGDVNYSPLLLRLKKQRFFCKSCGETFIANTTLAAKNCHISNLVKSKIVDLLTNELAMTTIAKQTFVSPNTVIRVLRSAANRFTKYKQLAEILCIDEFKSVKNCDGKMSFIFCDGQTHEILDIVESRRQSYLIDYFSRFDFSQRQKVKYIVMDMFKPYIQVIQSCFPNAKIIIDKFHIVQHLNRSLNRIRIETMNHFRYSRPTDYRKFKQLWKLILKNRESLDVEEYKYHRLFDGLMTEKMIVDYLVDMSEDLSKAYHIINDLKYDISTKNPKLFIDDLKNTRQYTLRRYVRTCINSITYYKDGIQLSLQKPYSNGPLEGINNRIKNIKRSGYGYRNFYNLRARALLVNRLFNERRQQHLAVAS